LTAAPWAVRQFEGDMTRRISWMRPWIWAILAGVSVAVIAGCLEAWRTDGRSEFAQNRYFAHGLYATGFRLLAQLVNRWALPATGAAVLLLASIRLGRLARGRARRLVRYGLPVLAVLGLAIAYFTVQQAQRILLVGGVTAGIAAVKPMLFSVYALAVPLAGLLWVYWQLLRRRRAARLAVSTHATMTAQTPALRERWRPVARLITGLLVRLLAVGTLLLAVSFFGINLAAVLCGVIARRTVRAQPNIIFIMIDTLRADHLGCYGYELNTTPNLDRFAGESTRFADAIAPSSWTAWSVSSLFTSEYPDVLFMSHAASLEIDPDQTDLSCAYGPSLRYTTLAEVLHDRGYLTNAIISNPWLNRAPGTTQGYAYYDDSGAKLNSDCSRTSPHVTQQAIKRLRRIHGRPFFLYLLYMDPHMPYVENEGFTFGDAARDLQQMAYLPRTVTAAQRQERRVALRKYNSEIAYTDHAIGQLFAELKRLNLYDASMIVVFSDHGEEFREHGAIGHCKTVYHEVIRVPLIVKMPHQRRGRVVPGNFPLIDLYPSVLATLQIPARGLALRGDSVNFATLLRSADKPIYSATDSSAKCVTLGRWKYAECPRQATREFFDLATDPLEQRNILPTPPAIADRLIADFAAWDAANIRQQFLLLDTDAIRHRMQTLSPESSEQQTLIKQLQTLGYLQQ